MKNKKLINLYLLTLSLIALITFILPLEKINPASIKNLAITIVYYTASIIMLICLVLIILISIINLFQNNYEANKFSLSFSFIAFIMTLIIVIIYATNLNIALSWGSIILIGEIFLLYSFNRIVKTANSFKNFGPFLKELFPKKTEKEEKHDVEIKEVSQEEFNYVSESAKEENK